MRMRIKAKLMLLMALMLVGLATVAASLGWTSALFSFFQSSPASTQQAANMNATFTGISTNESFFKNGGTIDLMNIVPGDEQSGTITIVNSSISQQAEYVGIAVQLDNTNGIFAPNPSSTAEGISVWYTYSLDGGLTQSQPYYVQLTDGAVVKVPVKLDKNQSVTFTLHWSMPLNTGNAFINTSGTMTVTAKAVQAKNNPSAATSFQ